MGIVTGGRSAGTCTGARALRGRLRSGLVDFVRRGAVEGGVATAFGGEVDGFVGGGIGIAGEVWTPGDVGGGGVTMLAVCAVGRLPRVSGELLGGVRVSLCQSGSEASLRKPCRSGRRSISEAMIAGSILIDSLVVVEALQAPGLRVLDLVVWSTSRWPMSLEANSEVPPCSLAEQRKITVLPEFSTIACAAAL